MLSYQHIYHAGNLADVQKHALLAWMLSYLTRKEKPLTYMESHAGRGLYQLDAPEAVKTGEAAAGVERVLTDGILPPDHPLLEAIADIRAKHGDHAYPGSPVIAASLLRVQDTMHFAELHPQEFAALEDALKGTGARNRQQDGYDLALSIAPPTPRRGMLLIDPSYEVKTEYARLPGIIAKLHRKWNVGIIALWYPILRDGRHAQMLNALEHQGLPGVVRHEVTFPAARENHGMIGSGMFIVNAPYGMEAQAKQLDQLFSHLV
ncbi:23S rRNA (adenine(2030)-N(6))-methyltransferase RlmJ [Epibacterium ulvae]|uniref:23S rRNA (adenine(2030)-N(6))-methyltransferase RlmJ n=1 Tax=Epibacterium ulvae TaxID=1156985 RepID=UPI001BFC33C0|nr:23S rRNA (adenine(2030)-N(6))-methyltransferase RlmJ [Epibacterium ulvae]MBT8155011.1 23S rRNA (adenine(2030)-N(6))-methyltransferase RlmJ [Epibacterium ulvae]